MSKILNDIKDDEIRVIKGIAGESPKSTKWWKWVVAALILLLLICLCILFWQKRNPSETSVPEEVTSVIVQEDVQERKEPAYTEINDTIINDISLRIYKPKHAKATLKMGKYDKQDASIVLIAQAADVRADNGEIVGSFVLDGKVLSEGSSKEGFCAIIGDEIAIGVAKNSSLFERAIDENGCFFRQWSLVNNGELVDDNPKGKSIRRALCQRGDEVFVVESLDKESFHDFSQSLVDMGVHNAIYLVGSIAYGWAKDKDGNINEFGQESEAFLQKNSSYIVWR